MSFDVDHILNEWTIDDDHADTTGNNHCDICALRMPCDWSRATADIHELGDHVKKIEAHNAQLQQRLLEIANGWIIDPAMANRIEAPVANTGHLMAMAARALRSPAETEHS